MFENTWHQEVIIVELYAAYDLIDKEGIEKEEGDAYVERERYLDSNDIVKDTAYHQIVYEGKLPETPLMEEFLIKEGILKPDTKEILFWVTW